MGRARGGSSPVYAPPRGQRHFQGATKNPYGAPRGGRSADTRVGNGSHKFHLHDMANFPKVLEVAGKVRERALQRGFPAMTGHAIEARRLDHARPMTRDDVIAALRNGQIIELNDGPDHDDCRMLLRDETGTCVVYSVGLHRVITCWWNDPEDTHSTLDLSNYKRLQQTGPGAEDAQKTLQVMLARGARAAAR